MLQSLAGRLTDVEGLKDVSLNFTTNIGDYIISDKIVISREDYLEKSSQINELRDLVKSKIVEDLER